MEKPDPVSRQSPASAAPDAVQQRFDRAAASWEENPARKLLAQNIVATLRRQVPLRTAMTALDYGCGTGLVTLEIKPHVGRMIGMDTSQGMLAILEEKLLALGEEAIETRQLDLTRQPAPDLQLYLVISAMALHHVADPPPLLATLAKLLKPGGYLVIADLDPEDGGFHQDKTGVYHPGFDRDWLMAQFRSLGLNDIVAATAHTIERPGSDGPRRYPIFLISGKKPE
jgi:tRNA (cmo5U34)-methyltransferase